MLSYGSPKERKTPEARLGERHILFHTLILFLIETISTATDSERHENPVNLVSIPEF